MSTSVAAPRPSPFVLWLMAIRPRTLSLSAVPVAVGSAIAWSGDGRINCLAIPLALVAAMAIQICSNLYNDVADHERGADGPDRLGPLRVTAAGLLSPSQMKRGAMVCTVVAALAGLSLVWMGGWPILLLGVASLLAAWAYTGGPLPIAYTPFGEICVLIFFGIGAVAGTYWLHLGRVTVASVLGGVAIGCFGSAVLLVNNYRDIVADTRAGRRTLAIVAGPRISRWLYALLMVTPFALLPVFDLLLRGGHAWVALVGLPLALVMVRRFFREAPGPAFNRILGQTAQVQLAYGLLLCVGLAL
ncbi:1,4-dihydroxy-2-naphthoate polyprenyltransferase [Telmatospirillum siberiense]|uniref:1,4-dihydroxy-2-naphthoate octaprenyltransferase n=1 Tax=Telmatospirillum siberiense TaxID=382514 RepID=A0A2N3Q1H1_9PROT|nr:1,4-dihydroxy-2-naphthoate polyprenyltransferase [Telmatospirillum siberiense]PKU26506.1 1,4-dihydroxy-2-naphthoate octaprenyltransferase [Telmatospirillum siberiense]